MSGFLRWTPSGRTLRVIALIAATLLPVAGIVLVYYEDGIYRAQKIEQVRVQAQILASGVEAALVFDDNRTAQEYVNAMRANGELETVGVYRPGGPIVAGFVRGAAQLPLRAKAGLASTENGTFVITVPVMENGQAVGTVYLSAMMEPFQRRFGRYFVILLLVTMAALVIAVFSNAQAALARANAELEKRALAVSDANRKLLVEMEERAKAEEALRQSQKMEAIGQLSGGIAHDFNNLLTVIKGNLALLQRRLTQGHTDVTKYVDSAIEGLNRATSVTQRILAFSRRQPLSPKPVDLNALIGGMTELIRHSVGEQIKLFFDLRSTWPVLCDANQMENVILNLSINARDAMHGGGSLRIATSDVHLDQTSADFEGAPPGDYVRVAISDTGAGMSEEVRTKAIDPFFTTKPVGQGTGLGLSMTFGYVRQSGGAMNIESAPGIGTTIIILMPRVRDNMP